MAYLDTTSKDFSKPSSMDIHPYVYKRPKYEHYIDTAAEKVAPRVFTNVVGGPASVIYKIVDKTSKKQGSN